MLSVISTLMFALFPAFGGGDTSELTASSWLNPPQIRVPDDRAYVLLFFTLQHPPNRHLIERLNELHRLRTYVVVGLAPDSAARLKHFVNDADINFAVGAGSRSYKSFRITTFPSLILLVNDSAQIIAADHLTEAAEQWLTHARTHLSGRFDESSSVSELRYHAAAHPDFYERQRALKLLGMKMSSQAFMDFCDEMLAQNLAPRERGRIAVARKRADPNEVGWKPSSPRAGELDKEYRTNPEDRHWATVNEYIKQRHRPQQLLDDYLSHNSDSDDDLLIRLQIAFKLYALAENGKPEEQTTVRGILMQILPDERDLHIRWIIAGGLWACSETGDLELADYLDEQRKSETDIGKVEPMMHSAIHNLRTGQTNESTPPWPPGVTGNANRGGSMPMWALIVTVVGALLVFMRRFGALEQRVEHLEVSHRDMQQLIEKENEKEKEKGKEAMAARWRA